MVAPKIENNIKIFAKRRNRWKYISNNINIDGIMELYPAHRYEYGIEINAAK